MLVVFLLSGVSFASNNLSPKFEGCKDLSVISGFTAKVEYDFIRQYFPISDNTIDLTKRFWMRYGNIWIGELEYQCVIAELKKNFADYYLEKAKSESIVDNISEEVNNLEFVLGFYPENYNTAYLLWSAYNKIKNFEWAYTQFDKVITNSKDTQLVKKAKEAIKPAEKYLRTTSAEEAKTILWDKAGMIETLAEEINKASHEQQKHVKEILEWFMESEDNYTKNLGIYLYYLLQ